MLGEPEEAIESVANQTRVDPDRPTAISADGWVYFVDDGEIVGRADSGPAWRPETREDVEWTLELRAKIEAKRAAVRLRKEAMMANFAKLEREPERELAFWDWKYGPDVIAFVRRDLEGSRARSKQFENGRVSFRATQGTNKITDDEAAVHFVEERDPLAIKVTRSVSVKDVLRVAAEHGDTRPTMAHFLHSTGPSESVAIETGVGK